jgi:hypothetical protein
MENKHWKLLKTIRSGAIDIVVIDSVCSWLKKKVRLKAKWEIQNGSSRPFNVSSFEKVNRNN